MQTSKTSPVQMRAKPIIAILKVKFKELSQTSLAVQFHIKDILVFNATPIFLKLIFLNLPRLSEFIQNFIFIERGSKMFINSLR